MAIDRIPPGLIPSSGSHNFYGRHDPGSSSEGSTSWPRGIGVCCTYLKAVSLL